MEGAEQVDEYDKSFIEVPAILDKHKAAAEVCQGKFFNQHHKYTFIQIS